MSITPSKIKLHRSEQRLELTFDGNTYSLTAEFLRVHSPSAEVRGHGPNQAVLQAGKKDVGIEKIAMAGNYAIQLYFSDGHDSGIYSWEYLHTLCLQKDDYWQAYLHALHDAGQSRDPQTQIVRILPSSTNKH